MVSSSDILHAGILIVDDQEANVRLLEQMLSDAGYTCISSTMDPHAVYALHLEKKFDLILVDGFNEHAHPGQLNSLPFYQACRSRLSDQGIMAVNLLGLCKGVLGGFAHILTAFNERALLFPSCESGNTIAFATEGELVNINLEDLKTAAIALQEDTGLNLLPTLSRLEKSNICTNSTLII